MTVKCRDGDIIRAVMSFPLGDFDGMRGGIGSLSPLALVCAVVAAVFAYNSAAYLRELALANGTDFTSAVPFFAVLGIFLVVYKTCVYAAKNFHHGIMLSLAVVAVAAGIVRAVEYGVLLFWFGAEVAIKRWIEIWNLPL